MRKSTLTRQVASTYNVRILPSETISQQEAAYKTLLQKWWQASPTTVKEILAKREIVEPEPELAPETIAKLRQRIAEASSDK